MTNKDVTYEADDMKEAREHAREFGVDPDLFSVADIYTNTWNAMTSEGELETLKQFKIRWKREVEDSAGDLLRNLAKENIKPITIPKATNRGKLFCVMSIPDLHIGKLAYYPETGNTYDINIARTRYITAVKSLMKQMMMYDINEVIFPVGSDYLHIDNDNNTTGNGTPQDTDSRYSKILLEGTKALLSTVDTLATKYAVQLDYVPGNHDYNSCLAAMLAASERYSATKHITVNIDTFQPRTYVERGNNLIGFDHGEGAKFTELPKLMAAENSEAWGRCKHRHFFRGHLHTSKDIYTVTSDTQGGVYISYLSSLANSDLWHSKKGFTMNPPMASAFIFDKHLGCIAELRHTAQ